MQGLVTVDHVIVDEPKVGPYDLLTVLLYECGLVEPRSLGMKAIQQNLGAALCLH